MNIEVRSLLRSDFLRAVTVVALILSAPRSASGWQGTTARDTTFETGLTAGESDGEPRRRQLLNRLRLDLGFTTFALGGGLLYDGAIFQPDSTSEDHFKLEPSIKVRDMRLLLSGKLHTKRAITWQAGIMRDMPTKTWLVRQTGFMIAVPEIWSHFFIGRAKEGFSLNKVMTGYDGWSMERLPFNDATVPLLADGIKWLGITPNRHFFWNFGLFTDWLSEGQTFSSYNNQVVLRTGWVPLVSDSGGTLLHLGLNFRAGDANQDSLQLKSKPESFLSPSFIDTGRIPADGSWQIGPEAYYRAGSLLLGGEYSVQKVHSFEENNPTFHGGEVVIAWLPTGETRTYNTIGSYFRAISPLKTVIQGGPGAWEPVVKFSYSDLSNGVIDGGVLRRLTPMLNWHLTDNVRLEFAYGFGILDRFGTRSKTHFFQSRLQMQL